MVGPTVHTMPVMSKSMLERRLAETGARLKQMRAEVTVVDEQLAHFAHEADDARLRALVSETPIADREHRDAARHAETMRRHRETVLAEIAELERAQDELLDRYLSDS